MTNKELISHEEDFGPLLYGSKDCLFSHGKGALLYTSDGKEYIDFIAGHGVGNLGHSHPKVVKAIEEQAKKLIVLHSSFPNEQRATLFKKLAEVTPKQITNTFLSNSGTESVEAAIKLAIVSHRQIKKPHIIAMKRGFHGRSLGSLALTFGRRYRKPFKTSLGLDVSFASFGDIDDVKANIKDSTVGIITEVVQGEGGIYVAPDEFPKQLRELCDERDLALIFDEVQSGVGRTGKFFAFEHYNVVPDIICVAKSIASGVPMGATLARREYYEAFKRGEHASTFGGNPLSCAAANATIDTILSENLMENARMIEQKFTETVDAWQEEEKYLGKLIREQRGLGAMQGIQLKTKAGKYLKRAYKKNLLLLNAGMTVIRALPPLVTTEEQVNKALNILKECLVQKK